MMASTKNGATSRFSSLLSATREQTTAEQIPEVMVDEGNLPVRGRPRGKRSDPGYAQVTAYIRADTHRRVKIALLQDGTGQEFSELVDSLLSEWLKMRS